MTSLAEDVTSIMLDPSIRDWVLLPIFLVMAMQGALRSFLAIYMKATPPKPPVETTKKMQLLRKSAMFRANMGYLPKSAVLMRKKYYVDKAFTPQPKQADDEKEDPLAKMQDPSAAMGPMMANMAMIVPNMLMMGWVSYFFSGFVLLKMPFGLSERFRSMLQNGVNIASLSPSYVSGLSFYVICTFGLRGLNSVLLGSNNASDPAQMMKAQQEMQMGMAGGGMGGQGPDFNALYNTERTELEIARHEYRVEGSEQRLLAKLVEQHLSFKK